jgi:hypothetical protein
MTSQIASSNIDEQFPVAGQDNDSQGFRDNFSIIKNGLATASTEITELQNITAKVDSPNNFNGILIENALTNRLYGKVFSATTTVGTNVIDYTSGEYHVVTVAGNHSLRFEEFSGTDAAPAYAKIRLELSPNGAGPSGWNVTFTAPAGGSVIGTIGFPTPGENPSINIGDDEDLKTIVDVWSTNGKDFYVGLIGSFSQDKTAFYTGSENLVGSAASTELSTSYFSTNKVSAVSVGGINNNYSVIPTILFAAPTSGVTATGTVLAGVASVAVANAGTGYTVGNVLTIVGGTGTAATVTVATITGGGATGPIGTVTLTTAGNYSVLADLTDLTVTGGTGNSALITITALKINSVVITESGSGYTSVPAITINPIGNATLTALTNLGTATLAAGVEGQVKTFAMYSDSGDMVITVTNAGWKTTGTGTITFSTIGQACTLQYINSKWFCVGNNGVSFL